MSSDNDKQNKNSVLQLKKLVNYLKQQGIDASIVKKPTLKFNNFS